jgi:hypothetical protein
LLKRGATIAVLTRFFTRGARSHLTIVECLAYPYTSRPTMSVKTADSSSYHEQY